MTSELFAPGVSIRVSERLRVVSVLKESTWCFRVRKGVLCGGAVWFYDLSGFGVWSLGC